MMRTGRTEILTELPPCPMDEIEPGVLVIKDEFFKEMMQRIRLHSWDLTMRKVNNGYVIELVVRHSIRSHDANTIGYFDTSALANEHIGALLLKAKEYAKFDQSI